MWEEKTPYKVIRLKKKVIFQFNLHSHRLRLYITGSTSLKTFQINITRFSCDVPFRWSHEITINFPYANTRNWVTYRGYTTRIYAAQLNYFDAATSIIAFLNISEKFLNTKLFLEKLSKWPTKLKTETKGCSA